MEPNDLLIINYHYTVEGKNDILGFVKIPLLELYKTLKTTKKQKGTSLCEWFNIVNCDKNNQIFVVGKTKVPFQYFNCYK